MCGVLHDVVNLHIQNLYYICGQILSQATGGMCPVNRAWHFAV